MNWLYVLLGFDLVLQVFLFVIGRRIRKKEKENNVLLKYKIDSRQKAWKMMADQSVPEEDRRKIQEIYDGEEN